MASSRLKENFAVQTKCKAFFTGNRVQLSEDGNYIFCPCGNVINILEIATSQVIKTIGNEETNDEITSFVVSPDDKFLVIAVKNLIQQWDWKENKIIRAWKAIHISPISSMTYDSTSTLLATGGCDSTIKVWDIEKQYCTHNLKGSHGVVRLVKFHPNISKLKLFSVADDCKIKVWNLVSGFCEGEFGDHFSHITSIEIADDVTMFSSGRDKVVIMWNIESLKAVKVIPVYESLESLIVVPKNQKYPDLNISSLDDFHVITAGEKGILRIWNTNSALCVYSQEISNTDQKLNYKGDSKESFNRNLSNDEMDESESSPKQNIIFSAFHKILNMAVVVTFEYNILLYSMKNLSLYKQFVGHNDEVLDLCLLGKNENYLAVSTNSPHIKVYMINNLNCQVIKGHSDTVLALDAFRDGITFASSSKDCTIIIWSLNEETGCIHYNAIAKGHTSPVTSIACTSLKNKFIVSVSEDQTLKIWDLSQLGDPFSSEIKSLIKRNNVIAHDKAINSVTISPNDKLIASGSLDRTAKLWLANSGELLGVFRGHKRSIWCVKFSPVDQILATSSADGNINFWNLNNFTCVKTFEGHETSVISIIFLSRGMQLMSAASDGLMKLWTIKSGDCIKTWDEHNGKIWKLYTNKTEDIVISGSSDSNIFIWKDVTEEEKKAIREKNEQIVLQEQELSNLLKQKKYVKALGLTIALNQPFKSLNILKEIIYDEKNESITEVILKLHQDQLDSLLQFALLWNTNSRNCHEAQHVISIILENFLPEEIKAFTKIKNVIEGLIPYSERHFKRIDRLMEQAMFLDYTWQCMRPVI